MKIYELFNDDLEEGRLAKWAALFGLSAAAGAGLGAYTQPSEQPVPAAPSQSIQQSQTQSQAQSAITKPVTQPAQPVKSGPSTASKANPKIQYFLKTYAIKAGLRGNELAAFLAQTAHETLGFNRLEEFGDEDYFQNMYDIKGNPIKAAQLGNTDIGDGAKYKGRGFIHLTGRANYKRVGKALHLPLEEHPELAAQPANAAKIAIWFWKNKVKPNVTNWNDVRSVTYKINPAMKNIDDREANYLHYLKLLIPKNKPKK